MASNEAVPRRSKGIVYDVDALAAYFNRHGYRLGADHELEEGHAFAERMMQTTLIPLSVLERVNAVTRSSAWFMGSPIVGQFFLIPLNEAGTLAVREGTFVPADPKAEYLVGPGGDLHGVYLWVFSGETPEARRGIYAITSAVQAEHFNTIATFARAATEAGRMSMVRLGMHPLETSKIPDLWVMEPDEELA
jgi:hypothetical protein